MKARKPHPNPRRGKLPGAILIPVLALLVQGCEEPGVTDAGPMDDLGRQILEAIASVRSLDLSEVAIVDSWNWDWGGFDEPELAAAIEKYTTGEFPGIVLECDPDRHAESAEACFPFSLDGLPPEGVMIFEAAPVDLSSARTSAGVAHYYLTASGQSEERIYTVDLERLQGGRWKVGKGRCISWCA